MTEKLKNIMEDAARDFLSSSLSLRFDICTCQVCREDMLARMLAQIPPKYVSIYETNLKAVLEQAKSESRNQVVRCGILAIDEVSKKPKHPVSGDLEESFKLLLGRILDDRGLDFRQYHKAVIKRKVASRMYLNGLKSYFDYASFLSRNKQEYDKLLEELCINVTEFFRDPEVWVTVRYLFETLINQKKARNELSIKIWSAGCASGEEPYSIAILLKELLKDDFRRFSVELCATDIDKKCLTQAKFGLYSKDSLKNADEKRLKGCFSPDAAGNFRINPEFREMVKFQYLDMINEAPITDVDVIFCRNVFIYFNRSLQELLLTKFYNSLKPGGYLVKGRAEAIFTEAKDIFENVDLNARIYRKI